jgi:hypothetical protein
MNNHEIRWVSAMLNGERVLQIARGEAALALSNVTAEAFQLRIRN